MTLIVEDGTGRADANGFVSLVDLKARADLLGKSYGADDALIEAAIVRATAVISEGFAWQGLRRHGRSQALSWPRTSVQDREGLSVPFDSLPIELVYATVVLAVEEIATPGKMTPEFLASERVKREQFGDVSFEYVAPTGGPEGWQRHGRADRYD